MIRTAQTDEALLASGDLNDFGRFYDRYVRSLLAFFQRRVADPELAADLTAETFAAALVARRRYRPRSAPASAWLFAIARHKLADHGRHGSAEGRMRARLGMEPVPVGAEDAEMIRLLGDEVAAEILEDLPADQREAVRAYVIEGREYADIARNSDVTEATVRKRVSRGLQVLRERSGGTR
jgi:RNA polymerase sigma factor (sigma-70 family)